MFRFTMKIRIKKLSLLRTLLRALLGTLLGMVVLFSGKAVAQSPSITVAVTIPPLAGMIAPLLSDHDKVEVLLQEGASPHGFSLKPSHLKLMKHADLALMIGSPVDAWAHKSFAQYPQKTLVLNQLAGIERLPFRKGGLWEKKRLVTSSTATHYSTHAKPAGQNHDVNVDDSAPSHVHGYDEQLSSHSETMKYDGHLWMSIHNARQLINAFALKLQTLRPQQAEQIEQRLQAWLAKLEQTDQRVAKQLSALRDQPFMVLHDGFQYFEQHYGLTGIGSIRLNPEVQPSIKRLLSLRKTLKSQKIQCIFKEPQFPSKQIEKLAKGTSVHIGELDPMGNVYAREQHAHFVDYSQFIQQLGNAFHNCLQK